MTTDENWTPVTRKELYEQVWSTPMSKLCKRYDWSDVGLRKFCVKCGIPTPKAGYWAKLQHGKKVTRPPLPILEGDDPNGAEVVLRVDDSVEVLDEATPEAIAREKKPENRIVVGDELVDPLPVIERTQKSLLSAKVEENGLVRPKGKGCLAVCVAPASIDRAMRIMDALLKALHTRGIDGQCSDQSEVLNQFKVDGEPLIVRLDESLSRRERELSPKERQERQKFTFLRKPPEYEYFPSGILGLHVAGGIGRHCRRVWQDAENRKLEASLNAFIAGLYRIAEADRFAREEQEQRERMWAEQRRQREEEARLGREEEERIRHLDEYLKRFDQCRRIREFCDAYEAKAASLELVIEPGSDAEKWLRWARQRADTLDPIWFT